MKTRTKPAFRKFELRISAYGNSYYVERIAKLERLLSLKPKVVQIDLIGIGEVPADLALLLRSVLLKRSPKTKIVTNARSSLQNGAVLVWLLGDRRIIRDDARVFFRRTELSEEEQAESHAGVNDKENKYKDSFSEIEPEEGDYLQVLQCINEFLPVKELAGRFIGLPVLRQFGIVESDGQDNFLATAFSKSDRVLAFR